MASARPWYVQRRSRGGVVALSRWLGLWRPVAGRARSDWPFLVAVWLLIVSVTTLLAAGTLYADTVEDGSLRRALAEASPEERVVSLRTQAAPGEVAGFDAAVRPILEDAFASAGAAVALTARSSTLQPAGPAAPGERRLVVLGAYEAIADHAELLEGSWPTASSDGPLEAATSSGAADALGLGVGDRLALADAATPGADPNVVLVEVVVVGVFVTDASDPYWLANPLDIDGIDESGSVALAGPLMVDAGELLAAGRFTRLDLFWRAVPNAAGMRLATLDDVRAGLRGIPSRVTAALPAGRFMSVGDRLGELLGRIDRSSLVSRGGVLLTTLQFALLAGYAVLLVGGILAERRRPEAALLRARGASTAEIGLIAAGEAALLSVPAVLLAPWLALAVVEGIGRWGALGESGIVAGAALDEAVWLVALATGALCLAALTLPALLGEIDLARVRAAIGRPLRQSAAQRLGIDLVLLVLAVVGVLQLRAYGGTLTSSAGGQLEIDPLLVAAPAIALVAGAVLVVRLVPRLGATADWLLRRRRGALLAYAARLPARRPLRYTRSVLLIALAVALGTFGALYDATWSQSQRDQAAYQAGADVRVVRGQQSRTPAMEMAGQLAGLPGVEALSPLVRAQVDVGRAIRRANLLAVDPASLLAVADLSGPAGDGARAAVARLASSPEDAPGLELPADARRLAVTLDALLRDQAGRIDPPTWPGITVTPLVAVGGGDAAPLATEPAVYERAGQVLSFALPAQADATSPRSLVALELTIGAPGNTLGELQLASLATSAAEAGEEWRPLADPATLTDWSFVFRRSLAAGGFPSLPDGEDFGGPVVRGDDEHPLPSCATSSAAGCEDRFPHFYRWAAGIDQLAALASSSFLSASGTAVGDQVTTYLSGDLELVIAGSLETFPSLDPAVPFLLIDVRSLDRVRSQRNLDPAPPTEWWLAVEEGSQAAVAAAARRAPIGAQEVISRPELTVSLQRDPIALGMVGALLLGSLAAAAFAAIGLLVSAIVAAREQTGELALLRALGVSRRQVVGLLSIEQAFMLAIGLLAGLGLGWLIGVLVLPHAPLNRSGAAVVPSPTIVVPWEAVGLVVLAALAVLLLCVLAARREATGRPLVDVLRERED